MIRSILGALLLLCSITTFAQTPRDSAAFARTEWQRTNLGQGSECLYAQIDLFDSKQSISVVSYPSKAFATEILHLDREARTTSTLGEESSSAFAINGSYFNVKTFEPVTFVMIDRKVVGRTTTEELTRTNGMLAFKDKRGRKMDIFFCDTTDYPRVARRYRTAMAAGPMLVHEGKVISYDSDKTFYTLRHPRSLIGKRSNGEIVLVVIDGRFKGQGEGTTIEETALIARLLGLEEALNLDGGGSSTLWTAQRGVLNHPYDNKRFDHEGQREVPNCIAIKVLK